MAKPAALLLFAAAASPVAHEASSAVPADTTPSAEASPIAPAPTSAPTPSKPRFPGFAAALAEQPTITGPGAWTILPYADAWAALAASTAETRQQARWAYARSLVGQGLGSEALGVLDVARSDDPDLALVPAWQLARGAALIQMGQYAEALEALGGAELATNAEACAWRMRGMGEAGLAQQAIAQVDCALPAINARTGRQRAPFVLAASRAAVEGGRPAQALKWLALLPDRDPAANLYRGRAYLALGDAQAGRLRLDRVGLSGTAEQRMDARLSTLEAGVADHSILPADALKQLDQIRFTWRGGDIEQRALQLTVRLSADRHDTYRSLAAGAALFRYFDLGAEAGPTLVSLRTQFTQALAPQSGMPLDKAAGLYWDFRDLAPGGAEGDLLVSRLADRLQAAGLYGRAAELLQYQLTARARDLAQGPLSVRVASLYILAARPDRALGALRASEGPLYPEQMLWDRHRVEATALHLLGRTSEALAVLQDVPDGNRIRSEILWQKQDWTSLVATNEANLPRPGALNDVDQTIVLRQAIGLAMLGREAPLARLKSRYAGSFAKLPTAATFDVLTDPVGAIDPAALSKAMAALPAASPAGAIADLLATNTKSVQLPAA
ncbi:hypothetical protein ACBY01_04425 [Sphingomonas sp. ac-8]|uniref:hypothetical protein n=1 Tax=Sphingomonas sp. ac-8 TaxID=3242977 RepID=UPI003A80A4A8